MSTTDTQAEELATIHRDIADIRQRAQHRPDFVAILDALEMLLTLAERRTLPRVH